MALIGCAARTRRIRGRGRSARGTEISHGRISIRRSRPAGCREPRPAVAAALERSRSRVDVQRPALGRHHHVVGSVYTLEQVRQLSLGTASTLSTRTGPSFASAGS